MLPKDRERRQLGIYYAMAQVGLEMVVPVGLGWWVDEKLGTGPWLLIGGVILGFIVGVVHLVALSKSANGRDDKKDQDRPA
jgi:F0F1-type ATP synthase assembly protein I